MIEEIRTLVDELRHVPEFGTLDLLARALAYLLEAEAQRLAKEDE